MSSHHKLGPACPAAKQLKALGLRQSHFHFLCQRYQATPKLYQQLIQWYLLSRVTYDQSELKAATMEPNGVSWRSQVFSREE